MADRFQERGRFDERGRFGERYDPRDQTTMASGINLLAGIWLLISPWVFGAAEGTLWNAVIVGIVIAAIAAMRLYGGTSAPGLSWVNAVLGAWMIAAPFVLDYTGNAGMTWNSVIVGLIVLIFGIVSATSGEAGSYGYARTAGYGSAYGGAERGRYGWGGEGYGRGEASQRGEGERWGGAGYAGTGRELGRGAFASAGEYRGVGPKGWRRSDDDIRNDVCSRLCDDPELDASDVDIRVENAEVVLTGTVPTRQGRRLAEELAESVSGVRHVQNDLRTRGYGTGAPEAPRRVA